MIGKVSLGNCVTILGSKLYKQQHLQGTTAVSFEWDGAKLLHCNNIYSFVTRPSQFCVTCCLYMYQLLQVVTKSCVDAGNNAQSQLKFSKSL